MCTSDNPALRVRGSSGKAGTPVASKMQILLLRATAMSYSATTRPSSPGRNAAPHGFHSSPRRSPPRCCCLSAFQTSFGRTSSDIQPVSSYASMSFMSSCFVVPDTPELCRVRRPLPPLLAILELLPGSVDERLATGGGSASRQSVTTCSTTSAFITTKSSTTTAEN